MVTGTIFSLRESHRFSETEKMVPVT